MVWLSARVLRASFVSGSATIVIAVACGGSVNGTRTEGASVGDSGTTEGDSGARSPQVGSGSTAGLEPTGGAGGSGGYYGACFAAGTPIATPQGSAAIERVRIGEEVLAYSAREERVVVERVTAVHVHTVEAIGALELADDRVLHVTGEHPVYLTDEARYERADHVVPGDGLLSLAGMSSGAFLTVGALGFTAGVLQGPVNVYNITVSGEHNYFAEGVLVHNKSGGAGGVVSPSCTETPQFWQGTEFFCPSAGCTYFGDATEHVTLNAAADAPVAGPEYPLPDGSPPEAGPDEPLALARAMICPDEGGTLPDVGYLAFDVEIADAIAQVALLTEESACAGSEVGQVWFGDDYVVEPRRWTTQCVQVLPTLLGRAVTVVAVTGTRVANVRAVASCECPRILKHNTTCGWRDAFGYAGGSACLPE